MLQYLNTAVIFLLFMIIGQSASGQFGLRTKYFRNNVADEVSQAYNTINAADDEILNTGFGIGIDYWLRLKNKRIEFLPEIEFTKSGSSIASELAPIKNIGNTTIGININTRVYPMDFEGDCDCPTFSNQSTLIKKGFYFEFSPGASFNELNYDLAQIDGTYQSLDFRYLSYKLGLGVGLDIGVSNLLTINPYARYNYHFVSGSANILDIEKAYGNLSQVELGLRFAIRFDAKNY